MVGGEEEPPGVKVLVIGLKAFHPSLPVIFFHLPESINREKEILEALYDPERADQVRITAWNPELGPTWFQLSAPPGCLLPTFHIEADPSLNLNMTDSGAESADDWAQMAFQVAAMNGIKGADGTPVTPPWFVAPEILFLKRKKGADHG